MNVVRNPSVLGVCSERQVLLYPTDWEDPFPGTMEEIKISIVNDRATGSKRERDEAAELTPCAKRSRHDAFSCSTPSSSFGSSSATQHLHFSSFHSQSENTVEHEEEEDSLLYGSDDEDDFDDIANLTSDQEDIILQDIIDPYHAAEPPETCNEVTTCVDPFRPSESQGENSAASLYKTLDVSDTLTEESEGDNYAAMPPSPCQSALDREEVSESIQSSVCNVKSPNELPTAETVVDSDLSTPLLGIKGVSSSQAPNSFSPKHLLQTLPRVEAALNRSEVLDFPFDCDIDNVLTISLGSPFSSDEDNGGELAAITTKGKSSEISVSKLPPQGSEFNQVSTANAACNSISVAAQHYSPLSLDTANLSKDPHYPHTAEPKPSKVPSATSTVVSVETKLSIASLGTGKTVEFEKPSEVKENKAVHNDPQSTTSLKDPTPSAAPTANGIQSKIVAPPCGKVQSSTDPKKEKPRIAIAPLCRPSFRDSISDFQLENDKNIYCHRVLMHITSPRQSKSEDPSIELASLLKQISQEHKNWQHPSDLSKRNHPRFGNKPSKRFTLNQWVIESGGSDQRFKDFPNTFQRSSIPSVLPFNS
ncbi:S100P-binding protein isoform X1 [Ranitomeya imitator]|uniref:S100P-binding protein isoform X1 n=1 Tax=Ranitomeya imitator TaxID=111125 RepID=UPI0037E88E51